MSSILTEVFKATIGLLVNKGRDKAAEKLKDGDVTDQKFRGLIVREIDDIKSKLDGLARSNLLASISFFKEGIELLYDVFDKARYRSEYGIATAQATAGMTGAEAVSVAKRMKKLDLNDLDESAVRSLSNAKKRFEDARRKATEAFNNEALQLSDRVLAMQYRVMATILETVDNPVDALPSCRVCIEEMHNLSAVKDCFTVELKQGFRARFNKDERRALISSTYHVNRVIYDVIEMVCVGSEQLSAKNVNWPCVETGKEKVDPLRDQRVAKVLEEQRMKECSVTVWSFGQGGKEKNKLKIPTCVAINADGQFIVGDNGDETVKVFDRSGHFILKIGSLIEGGERKIIRIHDVSTDEEGNIYALVERKGIGTQTREAYVLVYNSAGDQLRKFAVRSDLRRDSRLTVTKNKVLVAGGSMRVVDVYQTDGGYVCRFGYNILRGVTDITAGPDGRVLVLDGSDGCIHIFTEDGQQQSKFSIRSEEHLYYHVACHPGIKHVIVAGHEQETNHLHVAIYSEDGEYLRTVGLGERIKSVIGGIAVSMKGRIAAALQYEGKIVVFSFLKLFKGGTQ